MMLHALLRRTHPLSARPRLAIEAHCERDTYSDDREHDEDRSGDPRTDRSIPPLGNDTRNEYTESGPGDCAQDADQRADPSGN